MVPVFGAVLVLGVLLVAGGVLAPLPELLGAAAAPAMPAAAPPAPSAAVTSTALSMLDRFI